MLSVSSSTLPRMQKVARRQRQMARVIRAVFAGQHQELPVLLKHFQGRCQPMP